MWRRVGVHVSFAFCARSATRRVPPPLPPRAAKLPPPPPLPGAVAASAAAAVPWKSPHEVLSAFVEFIPTFYVPIHSVAAILSDDCRRHFVGRGRFLAFLKRYRFFFDLRVIDGVRCDVKLRDDLSHPLRGAADEKFLMTDIGDDVHYVARPDLITSVESIEQGNQSVALKPVAAPPAVHVRLEERVPVLERLRALVPADFALLDHVEEGVPEDVLFHPYFDCQGGLAAIASKFPEFFQVVEGMIRIRPPHLAPLALNDYTLDTSPIPSIARLLKEQVCASDIPQWVSVTSIYEQLSREQKQQIKREYKSFAGFLRSHGRSLSLSQDMLQVARWVPQRRATTDPTAQTTSTTTASSSSSSSPSSSETIATPAGATTTTTTTAIAKENTTDASAAVESKMTADMMMGTRVQYDYTHTQIINELFDKFPPNRTLNLNEVLALVAPEMRPSLPRKVLAWLASFPSYFIVDDPSEKDPLRVRVRRASDRQPLDVALVLYQHTPDGGLAEEELMRRLPDVHRDLVRRIGLRHIVNALPEWLALSDTMVLTRLQTEVELEHAIHSKELKRAVDDEEESGVEEAERRWPRMRYEGTMSAAVRPPPRRHGNGA